MISIDDRLDKQVDVNESAKIQFRLANIWHQKGKIERAIAGYQKTLHLQPDHIRASLELGTLMLEQERFSEAVDIFRNAIETNPNEARFHKNLVNAFAAQENLDAAFDYYQLERIDTKPIDLKSDDLLCCVVVRNEAARLPYFLSYYREKGVAKFLIVDNDSTDQTLSYLLGQLDVYVWHSPRSFNQANFGSAWFEVLLRKYGVGYWCLTVDTDELLYYPDCEHKTLPQLCRQLDQHHKTAFGAVLLDMYANKPIKDTHYEPGQDFLEVCPYFDRKFYHIKNEQSGPYKNHTAYFGGVRQRVFGRAGDYYLSKVPLLKYKPDVILAGGQHWTNHPQAEIVSAGGCLLHFKFFSSFHSYIDQEVRRKEHYDGAWQYQQYAQTIGQDEALSLYDPAHSVKLQNSRQLVELGIMQAGISAVESSANEPVPQVPQIRPLSGTQPRPFWSVMITVYKRTQYLPKALRSVVDQAPNLDEMQIDVVCDGGIDQTTRSEIQAIVERIGGDRVKLYCHPDRVGHPHIFNICIARARGYWVHILHDDDWVKPGFYQALRAGIEAEPDVGAAFCRQMFIDPTEHSYQTSWLERGAPGLIPDWLERIAVMCRVQFSAMVVKREAYEKVGGFCAQAKSAFDWEMWKRIAVHYPVWYEPEMLACIFRDGYAETDYLVKSGGQIADAFQAIEISRRYLPRPVADELTNKARDYYAMSALGIAKRQLLAGDYQAAFTNIREGLKGSQSERVKQALVAILIQAEDSRQTK
jgi:glycosyltransferase involved in cell wall biosynthesis